MYALRERRVHVTQEDFEMAVAKVMQKDSEKNMSIKKLWKWLFIPFRIKTILEKGRDFIALVQQQAIN